MITKAELEKMVVEGAEKHALANTPVSFNPEVIQYTEEYRHYMDIYWMKLGVFKSGASFVTGILMHEIERLKEENNVRNIPLFKIEIDRLQKELSEAKETIEYLKSGVHTCHDQCPKPICVKLRDKDATIQSLKDENGRMREALKLFVDNTWNEKYPCPDEVWHKGREALTQKAEE